MKISSHMVDAFAATSPLRAAAMRRFVPEELAQSCKVCGAVTSVEFAVTDDMWARIVPDEYWDLVVCVDCFDAFAHALGVDWRCGLRCMWFTGRYKLDLEVSYEGSEEG